MFPSVRVALSQVWHGDALSRRYCLAGYYALLFDFPGVLPMGVLPVRNTSPRDLLAGFDMLVLTGGGDPHPSLFHRDDMGSRNPELERPLWDMELLRAAEELDIPVLGICLGMQLMGIAHGAPLIQDITASVNGALFHQGTAENPVHHPVAVVSGSVLAEAVKSGDTVSSYHHQALEREPDGFSVTARSEDGLIEAIEGRGGRSLGVQWHPERDGTGRSLVKTMIRKWCGHDL
jgi:putative glutamine amidotransferase